MFESFRHYVQILRKLEKKNNQLHAVSRTQQGRQREHSVTTLCSHFLKKSGGIACGVAELNAALCFDTRAKK